jgi:hypothetical protein
MAQIQTIELPLHLARLLTVEDVAVRPNFSRSSIVLPKPTRKIGTIRTRSTLHGSSNISNIDLVKWAQVHTADDRHLHPSMCEGSHDA